MPQGASLLGLTTGTTVWELGEGSERRRLTIEGTPVRIGSAAENSVRLVDPSVSRRHAEVDVRPDGVFLRDLGSTNGTYLGGHRVRDAYLKAGSEVLFGKVPVRLVSVAERPAVAPLAADRLGELVGSSDCMRRLFGLLKRVAASEVGVVLHGETGTGKELAARAVHDASKRRDGPFSVLDCSAVDRELVSAELFGHEVGAFTGATTARAGAFERARGGTLFLDELGELPLDLQAKLLRALEAREVRRLGGQKTIAVDCRVVAATHRDLAAQVREGKFREDLYYRIAQVVLRLPPLRERRDDIPRLVELFRKREAEAGGPVCRFDETALDAIAALPLPGNVRELKNLVQRSCALAAGDRITAAELAELVGIGSLDAPPEPAPPALPASESPDGLGPLEVAQRDAMLKVLQANRWHRARSAEALGITRQTLRDRMRRLGIRVPERGESADDS